MDSIWIPTGFQIGSIWGQFSGRLCTRPCFIQGDAIRDRVVSIRLIRFDPYLLRNRRIRKRSQPIILQAVGNPPMLNHIHIIKLQNKSFLHQLLQRSSTAFDSDGDTGCIVDKAVIVRLHIQMQVQRLGILWERKKRVALRYFAADTSSARHEKSPHLPLHAAVTFVPGGTQRDTLLIKCPSWLVASDRCRR